MTGLNLFRGETDGKAFCFVVVNGAHAPLAQERPLSGDVDRGVLLGMDQGLAILLALVPGVVVIPWSAVVPVAMAVS